jgi:hypothetical protein
MNLIFNNIKKTMKALLLMIVFCSSPFFVHSMIKVKGQETQMPRSEWI